MGGKRNTPWSANYWSLLLLFVEVVETTAAAVTVLSGDDVIQGIFLHSEKVSGLLVEVTGLDTGRDSLSLD